MKIYIVGSIIEDTGRKTFFEGLRQADTIVILNTPPFICRKRIIVRCFKQKLGIEKCGYKPNFKMLRLMFMWSKNYSTGADGLKSRLQQFSSKTITLRTTKEIKLFLGGINNVQNCNP